MLREEGDNAKPITARDLKCMERLSVARAKCELREVVTKKDVEEVIDKLSELELDDEYKEEFIDLLKQL